LRRRRSENCVTRLAFENSGAFLVSLDFSFLKRPETFFLLCG
jgi:hypothetical protein